MALPALDGPDAPDAGRGAPDAAPLAREWRPPFQVGVRLVLSVHRRGPRDPAYRIGADGAVWRTSLTPDGPGTLRVTADITNTGRRYGDDVVQLYVHDKVASILQPVRRLAGFSRVTLAPGQTRTVTFTLGPSSLGYYDNLGRFAVEPGGFDVYVGDSSAGGLHGQFSVG